MDKKNLFTYANRTIEEFHLDPGNVYSYWRETFKKFLRTNWPQFYFSAGLYYCSSP